MEHFVLTEEQIAARKRVHYLLTEFENDCFRLADFRPEEELKEAMHIPTHLFSALKSCERNHIYDVTFKILIFLIENQQCERQFLWKMLVNLLQKDCSFFLPLVSEFITLFVSCKARLSQFVHQDELCLFHCMVLLKKQMHESAVKEMCTLNGQVKQSVFATYNEPSKAASSALLAGYKTILRYQNLEPVDETFKEIKRSFLNIFSKKTCEPLFAEPYTFVLMKLKLQEEAEAFLEKYVENECKSNEGISGALHALGIIKLHIPKASLKLIISFLEIIAEKDVGNPKVLDLCQHHLNILNSGMCSHPESESEAEAEDISFFPKLNGLNKCLHLMMYFLDCYVQRHVSPTDVIKEGWSVMAKILRRICVQEAKDCFQSIIDLWHNDRKRWWSCFHIPRAGLPSTLTPDDAKFYSHKGIVCYILESRDHQFVVGLMKLPECRLLKSLVDQLHQAKMKMDSHIEVLQKENGPIVEVPLVSKPILPQVEVKPPQTQRTPSWSRCNAIDSEAIAEEFHKHMLTTSALRLKKNYNTTASNRASTLQMLQLDVSNIISQRYARRRKIQVQKKYLRMTRAKRAATLSTCSVGSFESLDSEMDEIEDDGDDIFTDDTISQDEGDYSPNQHQQAKSLLVKKRWTTFIKTGRWGSFSVNGKTNSEEEFVPRISSDDDSDEVEREFNVCEVNRPGVIYNNYASSIPSLYASISPASSISNGYTPQFSSQPRDVWNNDRLKEFDSFSICSNSTTDGIANKINQVIRKLDVDIQTTNNHITGFDHADEEYVVEEDVIIPEEASSYPSSILNNMALSENESPDEDTVKEEIEFPEDTSNISHRRFSRSFQASSPDMFESLSEDEEREVLKRLDEKLELNQNKVEKRKSTMINKKTLLSSAVSTSFTVTTPLAVSTPITSRKKKEKKKVVESKKKQLRNNTQNKTKEQSSSNQRSSNTKKKSINGASRLERWDISLVNRVLKESLKESSVYQSVATPLDVSIPKRLSKNKTKRTRNTIKRSASDGHFSESIKSKNGIPYEDNWQKSLVDLLLKESLSKSQSSSKTNLNQHSADEVLLPIAISTRKHNGTTPKRSASPSFNKNLVIKKKKKKVNNKQSVSSGNSSESKSKNRIPNENCWQMSLVDCLLKKSLNEPQSPQAKSALRTNQPLDEVSQPIATSTRKHNGTTTKRSASPSFNKNSVIEKKKKKVNNKQSVSSGNSSESKSKNRIPNENCWQMSLVDRLLKKSLNEPQSPQAKSALRTNWNQPLDEVSQPIVTSTGKQSGSKTKKLASTSAARNKPLPDSKSVIKNGFSRKSHIRVRDSEYPSTPEDDSEVSDMSSFRKKAKFTV